MYKTPFGKSDDIIILSDCKIDMHNLVIVVKSKVYQCTSNNLWNMFREM